MLLLGYARSLFRDFESYFRIVVGLVEISIQLNLKQGISNFNTFERPPSIYSMKDISEAIYSMGDYESTMQTEHDEISLKIKLV